MAQGGGRGRAPGPAPPGAAPRPRGAGPGPRAPAPGGGPLGEALARRRAAAEAHCSRNTDVARTRVLEGLGPGGAHALWLGNEPDAEDAEALRADGIGAILNMARDVPEPPHAATGEFEYLHLEVDDVPAAAERLRAVLGPAIAFIDGALESSSVLVHCRLGRSRSASAVLAWMMAARGYSLEAGLADLKQKRRLYQGALVEPNEGFKRVLQEFEASLGVVS